MDELKEDSGMDRYVAMETFVRVVETGSFSAAARQLRVGQSTVSKIVAQLEDRLGVRLLIRSTHGLSPTEAGEIFHQRAKQALEQAEEAENAARGAGAALSGRLRVSAAVTFARLHIVPQLPAFLNQHPNLDIEVILEDREVGLIEEGIDVALRLGSLPDSGLTVRKIGQCPRLAVASPSYLARMGEPKTPEDLVRHQAVIYAQPDGAGVWQFRKGSKEVSVPAQGRVRMTAAEGVREAVIAGMGLTNASQWMFWPELERGIVKPILTDWTLPVQQLWAIFPSGRRASSKARAFVAFARATMDKSLALPSTEAAVGR